MPRGRRSPPAWLSATIGKTLEIEPPRPAVPLADIDPLQETEGRHTVERLRKLCLALAEAIESNRFGAQVWRAGCDWAEMRSLMLESYRRFAFSGC